MLTVTLGSTGIRINKNGFGALPIQRISDDAAVDLLRRAYDGGITFYDTARFYTDSEHKIGLAFAGMRDKIYVASKTMATTVEDFWSDLHTTLSELNMEYLDLYQFHNPSFCPRPGDGTGLYEAMLEAKEQGMICHIGITNHRQSVAMEAVESGLYETLQFPFCYLASKEDLALVQACKERDMGFIAMKGLSGGLLTNSAACYAFMTRFDNVLPIWGVQKQEELEEFLSYAINPPVLEGELAEVIRKDREELGGDFCRACGYCMPCPVGIEINNCARMSQLIRRSPSAAQLTPQVQAKMMKIEECLQCGQCAARCPYHLDTPTLLQKNLEDYKKILSGEIRV